MDFDFATLLFILFGGMAVGCAVSMVVQRNALYSAVSLVGVFIALGSLYLLLSSPFIAAVQVIVYAGAIMVLVVFVIMLLNVEEEARRPLRLIYLIPVAIGLAAVLIGQAAFILTLGGASSVNPRTTNKVVGLTSSVGTGLFTEYLLPFEITSVLILMALVGAITLARRATVARPESPADFPRRGEGLALVAESAGASGGGGVIQPGRTDATGQEVARQQIERNENSDE
ncbi:MAG TPA: NADH-quinone oxidoreductase subunit J [Pyrinomonadaceae bacterium]|nr:NADH-quinone oxidoreductase subunit J [Pyrinomonadaceae bacterium]